MTNNVVIALSCGTNDTNRATRAIHLATIAHKEGKNTTLFPLDEGVYLAKEGIITHVRAATGDVADDLLAFLQAHEVPILVSHSLRQGAADQGGGSDRRGPHGHRGRIHQHLL